MQLPPGERVGPWTVLGTLSDDGSGTLLRCKHEDGRYGAVRMTDRTKLGEQFRDQAFELANIAHPAIVGVIDVGSDEDRGLWYIALEDVVGVSLATRLAAGRLPPDETIRVFWHATAGLLHAHRRNVTHGNLRPQAIVIRTNGAACVQGFGVHPDEDYAGLVPDTMPYMAPDILSGSPPDLVKGDIYALGLLFCGAMTGERAFVEDKSEPAQVRMLTILAEKQGASVQDPGDEVPDAVRRLIRHATEADPARRLGMLDELVHALAAEVERADEQASTAPMAGRTRQPPTFGNGPTYAPPADPD